MCIVLKGEAHPKIEGDQIWNRQGVISEELTHSLATQYLRLGIEVKNEGVILVTYRRDDPPI